MTKKRSNEESKDRLRVKLEADIDAFLKAGGEIEVIPSGLSGVDSLKPRPRHITLGSAAQKS